MSSNSQPPAALWEALQTSSTRSRPTSKLLSSFENGITDVSESGQSNTTNKYDLLCPRAGCGSVILKKGVAKLEERESLQIEPSDIPPHPLLPPLPDPSESTHWWLIGPTPMEFENIGFSRPVESLALSSSGLALYSPLIDKRNNFATGRKLKLLACAECDLGPLGWSEEGGSEFWLASSRVGYRSADS